MFSCFIVMQKHSSCMIHGLNLGFNCSYLTLDKFINLAEASVASIMEGTKLLFWNSASMRSEL